MGHSHPIVSGVYAYTNCRACPYIHNNMRQGARKGNAGIPRAIRAVTVFVKTQFRPALVRRQRPNEPSRPWLYECSKLHEYQPRQTGRPIVSRTARAVKLNWPALRDGQALLRSTASQVTFFLLRLSPASHVAFQHRGFLFAVEVDEHRRSRTVTDPKQL